MFDRFFLERMSSKPSGIFYYLIITKKQQDYFFFASRFHPLRHIVHLLRHDIYIRKVIYEFLVPWYDEIDDVVIPVMLVFVL